MRYLMLTLPIFMLTGCWKTIAPTGLAIVGGAAGSPLGPLGAGIGAGSGAALGQIIKGEAEIIKAKEETQEIIKSLSEGDVKRMLEIQAGEQKGTFDKIVDGIYRLLYLGGICMVLWFVLPWIWAKKHVKKAVEKHINGGTK